MTIHHATAKKALEAKINLVDEDGEYSASNTKAPDFSIVGTNASGLLKLALHLRMMLAEYPGLECADDELRITSDMAEAEPLSLEDGRTPDDIDAWMGALSDADRALLTGSGDEDDAEEDEDRGSVVPNRYKMEYKARGHASHCGDFLAQVLNDYCRTPDDKGKDQFDPEKLIAIAECNGIADARKWTLIPSYTSPGAAGRFRMTIRNVLAKKVADARMIVIPDALTADGAGKEFVPDDAFVAKYATKVKTKAAVEKKAA